MININEKVFEYMQKGYSEAHASAKLTQDLLLNRISKSHLVEHMTIKGGVVVCNLSNQIRRATIDIDIDFMSYSIDDKNIENFFNKLNMVNDGVEFEIQYPIKELKQLDYKGKRIIFNIKDTFGNILNHAKLDLGVHKDLSIMQDEFAFQIDSSKEVAVLYINSKEQIFAEKLSSLLRHGLRSTRYKDVFDLYFLIKEMKLEFDKVMIIFNKMMISEKYNSSKEIANQLARILNNEVFAKNASKPNNDWLDDASYEDVVNVILNFFKESRRQNDFIPNNGEMDIQII